MTQTVRLLSIVIPAYNEERTIRHVVERILNAQLPVEREIIIVNDHSTDRTAKIVDLLQSFYSQCSIQVFHNGINQGKGRSIQIGLSHCKGDVVIIQDADLEYDPGDISKLLHVMMERKLDAVYGSRFLSGQKPRGMAFQNWMANVFLTWLTNILYDARLTDMETCYKLVKTDLLKSLELKASRFDFEPEITTKLIRKGVKLQEVPISYHGRNAAQGKKIKARDFFIALYVLFANRFK